MSVCKPARSQRGYILALNIAILALTFVGVSFISQRMSLTQKLAQIERHHMDAEYEIESAKSLVMFVLAGAPRSPRGLGLDDSAIVLDDRPYRLGENIIVSLQDVRGLVALNGVPLDGAGRERIERLLATYGIESGPAAMMTDTFLDYRDIDDLKRLNGAEKDEYRQAGQAMQIRNGDLIGVSELARIYGWASAQALWQQADPITRHVSLERYAFFNPNTADWRALVAMSGIDENAARAYVESRRTALTPDISGIVYGSGIGDPFGRNANINTFPGRTVIVTLRRHDLNWAYRIAATHTPDNDHSPWRIESVQRIALTERLIMEKLPRFRELAQLRDSAKPLQLQLPF